MLDIEGMVALGGPDHKGKIDYKNEIMANCFCPKYVCNIASRNVWLNA